MGDRTEAIERLLLIRDAIKKQKPFKGQAALSASISRYVDHLTHYQGDDLIGFFEQSAKRIEEAAAALYRQKYGGKEGRPCSRRR